MIALRVGVILFGLTFGGASFARGKSQSHRARPIRPPD